jgi:dUTP pyrophosphatase
MNDKVMIKLLNESAKIPQKATEFSSGFDLISSEDCIIGSGKYRLVSTGISIAMEKGMEAQVRPRSGLAVKNGITVLNAPGTIDADYRGEVKVALINHSDTDFKIEKGMRIAQMVFAKVADIELVRVDDLSETARGGGGFGSTGLK